MKTFFQVAVHLGIVILLASAYKLPQENEAGIRLSHFCVNPVTSHEKGAPVIMMHGLGSSKDTWAGIFQTVSFLTRRRVCIYDARNHGDSEWNDSFDVDVLAEDLGNFMQAKNIEKAALVGHSLGGLTAMRFALKNPHKVEKIVVEDIGPIINPIATEGAKFYLKTLINSLTVIPENADEITARKAVAEYLSKILNMTVSEDSDGPIRLVLRDGVWQWQSNMHVFSKALDDNESFFGKMEGKFDGEALFIYGEISQFQVPNQKEKITDLFPKAQLLGIAGAGHAIHTGFPRFLTEVVAFLK